MVEQERSEGMPAPSPEEEFRVLETTLAELGVDTSYDKLNLAADKLTLGVKRIGEDTVFAGLLHHPFAGDHFAQYLNSIAPFGDQDIQGIIDDVNLPILAERDYRDRVTSKYTWLHERHLGDPRVKIPYEQFAKDHARSWLNALESKSSRDVFRVLDRVKFVTNLKTFTDKYFSEVEERLLDPNNNRHKIYNIAWALLSQESLYGSEDFKSLFYDTRGLGEIKDFNLFSAYQELSIGEGVGLIKTFFERNPNSKQRFVLNWFFTPKVVLADLENGYLRGGSPDPNLQTRLVNVETLEIIDREGTRFLVVPNKNAVIPGGFGWRIRESKFSREYTDSVFHPPLYPTFAWIKREDGTRSFLTQKEAMPLVAELGLPEGEQGDVKLGEIGVGYFSRDIIKKWPISMALKPLEEAKRSPSRYDFEQPMRGAQMPAWVSIEAHKEELLRSETSPLAVLERKFSIYQ